MTAIFDMDGVLIDTVSRHWNAYNEILEEMYGVRVDDTEIANLIGMSLPEQLPILKKKFNIKIDADKFVPLANERKEQAMDGIEPKPGVVKLLRSLKDQGIKSGVGTSTSRITAIERLKNIGIYDCFSVVIGEEDVTHHKPDPEVYNLVAQKLDADPKATVVFEDAPSGIEAAISAGMKSVGICTTYTTREKLSRADLVVNSLEEVTLETIQMLLKRK